MKRWLYLSNLKISFFQRTNFINLNETKDFIFNNIHPIKKIDSSTQSLPGWINNKQSNLKIRIGEPLFSVVLMENKLELQLEGVYQPDDYDTSLFLFLDSAKKLVSIVASEYDLCGRIEMKNESFLIVDNPVNIITNRYIKNDSINQPSKIAIIYECDANIASYPSIIINTIKSGTLGFCPPPVGIEANRTISIKNTYLSISKEKIIEYIDYTSEFLSKQSIEQLIYV